MEAINLLRVLLQLVWKSSVWVSLLKPNFLKFQVWESALFYCYTDYQIFERWSSNKSPDQMKYTLFFNSASVLLNFFMNWASTFAWVLLNTYNNIILRHFTFGIFLTMSRSGSVMSYLCDLFFIFSLIFIVIYHIILFKQMYLFFGHFLEYLLLFLYDNLDEERGWRN